MKYIKKICGAAVSLLFVCVFITGAGLLALRLCGYQALAVQTGSMGAVYPVGSVVIADKSQPEDIQTGDIISFVADERLTVVTHRVVSIDTENRCFYTKGDNNNTEDTCPVLYENLLGKVVFSVPYIGYLVMSAQSRAGKRLLWFVIAAIVLYFLKQLIVLLLKRRKECHDEQSETDKRE